MILVIFPPYKHYKKITINADFYAVRNLCQIGDIEFDDSKLIFFDQFISQDVAESFNKRARSDSLNHTKTTNGQDATSYKGVSLVDINVNEISYKIFIPLYREALCFLSCVFQLKPSVIYLERHDEWFCLFDEISKQLGVRLKTFDNFGFSNINIKNLIKMSYAKVRDKDLHAPLKINKFLIFSVLAYNLWTTIVRIIRGKKPFVFLDFYGSMIHMKTKLLLNEKYYPVLSRPIKMKFNSMLLSGAKIVLFKDLNTSNKEIEKILKKYFEILEKHSVNNTIGQIRYLDKNISVANFLVNLLKTSALKAFKQIADNVDIWDKFILSGNFMGCVVGYDSSWKNRLIIRLCQKNNIPNTVIMNGYFADNFQMESKTANLTLCCSESIRDNYLNDKSNCIAVGSQSFDAAYKKRKQVSINLPPKNILVCSFTFSPVDINCHYSDNERFLLEILTVLKKISAESKFEFKVSLKLHPADNKAFNTWFLEYKNFKDIEIIANGDFQRIVSKFDLVIITYSTGLFEVALMGIPVIFYHPVNQILSEPFNGFESLLTAHTMEELENILKKAFQDQNYAYLFNDLEKLKPFTGPVDGETDKRIFNIISGQSD